MWRLCDLHNHTLPNEQCSDTWDAVSFVRSSLDIGLNLVAITDHDAAERSQDVIDAAAGTALQVVPGVELSTDRGHLLVLAPGQDGQTVIRDFLVRVGAVPGMQVSLDGVLAAAKETRPGGEHYAERLVLVGAHVDAPGSMLASANQLSLDAQLSLAEQLHALEVTNDEIMGEWVNAGVKQGPQLTLVKGSDEHSASRRRVRATWIYLPEISASAFHHAFALPEASIRLNNPAQAPSCIIESIGFTGGYLDGTRIDFCERANAIIGPPNAGKSLIVDAIKYVFGLHSDIGDVEKVSESRMAKCLPSGSTITLRARTAEDVISLARTVGSARPPTPPFRPIVFSQTELTRRAIEPIPSVGLLDLHCPTAAELKGEINDAASRVATLFRQLLEMAEQAATWRNSVTNPVDGLAATRAELETLAGTEEVANLAVGVAQIHGWRTKVGEAVGNCRETASLPALNLPPVPGVARQAPSLGQFAPTPEIDVALDDMHDRVAAAVSAAAEKIFAALDAQDEDFSRMQERAEAELAKAGFEQGGEVELRLREIRARLELLEEEERDLVRMDSDIDEHLVELRRLHSLASDARRALTEERRQACRRVNQSMRTFFARIEPTGEATHLDELIDELKTGTWMRATTRQELRDSLDRFRLLEIAVRQSQGLSSWTEESRDQDRLVAEALRRDRSRRLAKLSCLWPGDAMLLAQKGTPPTPFPELTEGLRALAIKEISFAASDLPVISDQPEDAVPTRAVFTSLVPTLRDQRARRQFIVVSHDANIVVASDVERIVVMQANEDKSPHVGSLFDERIRTAALEHLEGGQRAFRLRAERYAALERQPKRRQQPPSAPFSSDDHKSPLGGEGAPEA